METQFKRKIYSIDGVEIAHDPAWAIYLHTRETAGVVLVPTALGHIDSLAAVVAAKHANYSAETSRKVALCGLQSKLSDLIRDEAVAAGYTPPYDEVAESNARDTAAYAAKVALSSPDGEGYYWRIPDPVRFIKIHVSSHQEAVLRMGSITGGWPAGELVYVDEDGVATRWVEQEWVCEAAGPVKVGYVSTPNVAITEPTRIMAGDFRYKVSPGSDGHGSLEVSTGFEFSCFSSESRLVITPREADFDDEDHELASHKDHVFGSSPRQYTVRAAATGRITIDSLDDDNQGFAFSIEGVGDSLTLIPFDSDVSSVDCE